MTHLYVPNNFGALIESLDPRHVGLPDFNLAVGGNMHIAGRLALQSPSAVALDPFGPMLPDGRLAPSPNILSFQGCDVVVRQINQTGFEADLSTPLVKGALVSLRLPGAGVMIARVREYACGRLAADFVNPVSLNRLGKTLGVARMAQHVA